MRALTVDEVEEVGGAYEIHQYEGVQGQYQTYGIYGFRTPPTSPVFTPTNPYSNPSFPGSVCVFGSFDVLNWTAPVNGGFASQDAQLQCYADWLNAGSPDILGQTQALETVTVTASRAWSFDNNPYTNLQKAVEFCRNNTDPNTVVIQDATKLHVVQVTEFDSDGKASAHLSYDDPLWDVYGQVTLVKQSDGSITIANDKFDFDMKPWALGTTLRNTLTAIGGAIATGLGKYTCTPFNIEFQGSPIIVSGPKP